MADIPFIINGIGSSICRMKSQFEDTNPIIPNGVIAFETDTRRYKMGDGVSTYNKLIYASGDIQFSGRGKRLIGSKVPPYIQN